jgi:hypothetical protein
MSRRHITASVIAALVVASFVACSDPASTGIASRGSAALDRAGFDQAGAHRQYGTPQRVGDGTVRTYVVMDQKNAGRPLEVGVALSERALEGLPAPVASNDPMANMHMYTLDLPAQNPTQYKFVQFDWNPKGHEPDSVYTFPHFDFHFYTVPVEVRNSIVPSDPQYVQKAANLPPQNQWYPFHLDAGTLAGGVPQHLVTVPQMGLHWLDVRSPELQKLTGHPEAWQPFTKTFIYGSWDGQYIFDEPMITRAYILSKKAATDPSEIDEIIPVSTAQNYSPSGYYPSAYRITWDAQQKEYRIAVTQLSWKE